MHELGGHYSEFSEEQAEDLDMQRRISENKALVSSEVGDFVNLVTNSLRDSNQKFSAYVKRHSRIENNFAKATVGLARLRSLTNANNAFDLQRVTSKSNSLIHKHRNTKFLLEKCSSLLKEATTNYQMVGEMLKSKLADRHKKAAAQNELGLRLRDIQKMFDKCDGELTAEELEQAELGNEIQELLAIGGIKLPELVKESMSVDDRLSEIIVKNQKRYESPHKTVSVRNLGEDAGAAESVSESTEPGMATKDKLFYLLFGIAGAAAVAHFIK